MNRLLAMLRATSLLVCLGLVGCGGTYTFKESRLEAATAGEARHQAASTAKLRSRPAKTLRDNRDVTYPGEFEEVMTAFESGDLALATKMLTEVTTREPGHATAWANLGMVLSRSASNDEAIAALEQAVTIDPQLAPALNQLGVLYRRTGRLAEAERAYAQALAADPDNSRTHRNIGVLYDVYLARPADALRHYQRSLELEPEGETLAGWVAELERRVQVLEASNR